MRKQIAGAVAGMAVALLAATGSAAAGPLAGWTNDFAAERGDLVPTGRNRFFALEPGWVLRLAGGGAELRITVKDETRLIDGIVCRAVEEYETEGGQLVEVSNNYFAISRRTNSVYYFGEDAGGAWWSGENGARFGLMMPGLPLLGAKYYQEIAPGAAMDRAEMIAVDAVVRTPAGEFTGCLRTVETTPLEPDERSLKSYAPGIGLIEDGALQLVAFGREAPEPRRRRR